MKLLTKKELLDKVEAERNKKVEDQWFYFIVKFTDYLIDLYFEHIDNERINTVMENLQKDIFAKLVVMHKHEIITLQYSTIDDDVDWHYWVYQYRDKITDKLMNLGYHIYSYELIGTCIKITLG